MANTTQRWIFDEPYFAKCGSQHEPLLLDDGDGGFLGGLNAEKYMKITGASKATATRDLSAMLAADLLWTRGQGKSLRYFINVPGWGHGVAPEGEQPRLERRKG